MEITEQYVKDFFSLLTFDEPTHTYHIGTEKVKKSVSAKLKDFYKPFDAESIAPFVARKRGCSTEDILEEWKQSGLTATTLGTAVHYWGEVYARQDRTISPTNVQEDAIKQWFDSMPSHIIPFMEEIRSYHLEQKWSGTADGLLYNTKTGKFIIYDFKTNKTLRKCHRNQKMLQPFSHMLDQALSKYTLQLSMYKILLSQVPGLEIESMCLLHLPHEGGYEMIYTEDVSEQLKEYYSIK